jgi:monoamine oxidase
MQKSHLAELLKQAEAPVADVPDRNLRPQAFAVLLNYFLWGDKRESQSAFEKARRIQKAVSTPQTGGSL